MNSIQLLWYNSAADVSIIGCNVWKIIGERKLQPSPPLNVYPNAPIELLGETTVQVKVGGILCNAKIVIANQENCNSFGKI